MQVHSAFCPPHHSAFCPRVAGRNKQESIFDTPATELGIGKSRIGFGMNGMAFERIGTMNCFGSDRGDDNDRLKNFETSGIGGGGDLFRKSFSNGFGTSGTGGRGDLFRSNQILSPSTGLFGASSVPSGGLFGAQSSGDIPKEEQQPIKKFHYPPPGVDYDSNPSVFAKILKGELPAYIYQENEQLLAFRDKRPKAKFHALVIPKKYVKSVKTLAKSDLGLTLSMREMALNILQEEQPKAFMNKDYLLCFHVPPFNSVDHLHLHVLAPVSDMNYCLRYGKYLINTMWCVSDNYVVETLRLGKAVRNGL